MKILITGATGFIGSALAEQLSGQKHEVFCLVRSSSNLRWISDLNVRLVYGELTRRETLDPLVKDMDVVYHLAGVTKGRDNNAYEEGNFTATKNLVDALLQNNRKLKRIVFTGTQAAYGPSPGLEPVDEESIPRPLTDYGHSKLKAQRYLQSEGKKLPWTIVLPPVVYGPRDTDVLEFFKTVKMGIIPKVGGHDKYTSIIHVDDLVKGLMLAAINDKAAGEIFFVANKKPVAWREIARIAMQVLGKKALEVPVPMPLVRAIAGVSEGIAKISGGTTIINRQKVLEMEPDFWICSSRKARVLLDFDEAISLERGIKETLAWYKQHGWL